MPDLEQKLWQEFRVRFPGVHKVYFQRLFNLIKQLNVENLPEIFWAFCLILDPKKVCNVGLAKPTIKCSVAGGFEKKNPKTGEWGTIKT